MFNKKIVAAGIAAAFTFQAQAALDLTSTTAQTVLFESATANLGALNADGLAIVTNNTNLLDVTTPIGFTIGSGTNKYVRVDLTDAQFNVSPTLAVAASGGGAAPTANVAQGGAAGDTFVIFEVTAGAAAADNVTSADVATVAGATYRISPSTSSTFTYALYETAGDAVSQTNALFTDSTTFTSVASANTGDFSTAETLTATVASQFTQVRNDADTADVTENSVGALDADELLSATTHYTAAGVAVTIADISTANQAVNFAGNFSVGAWELNAAADCSGATVAALTINADKDGATSAAYAVSTAAWLCVDNAGATPSALAKGSYTATLATDNITNTVGTIVYDTTSITIPYITTFADYNQRIYIINNGPSVANYTTTFVTEDGVTATGGSAATGSVPAGEMVAIKATDLVTLAGKTRASATIEIEAVNTNVIATSQSVNLSDGTTDTVKLTVQ